MSWSTEFKESKNKANWLRGGAKIQESKKQKELAEKQGRYPGV